MSDVSPGLRRLPVYLLLDCSGSMFGEPIEAVRQGLSLLRSDLQSDPQALETVWLSVITFETDAKQVVPLTPIDQFSEPTLQASGATSMGAAIKLLMECIDREVRKTSATQKGDFKPLVFLMTDGIATDNWEGAADELKKRRPGNIIACAAGSGADEQALKRATEIVVKLTDTSPGTLQAFFRWVTASVSTTSASVSAKGDAPVNMPMPSAEEGIVIVP
ncbi:VWA domain-containing protein [Blastopirellula sp. JC732]|uniref:VWA domain-containing protein n=1 Tax=Blastopirellula sediminis TaxID=2894196 RepID=A0A9X1MK53_9BACT|nr:VWA domain-containing protein [Blastopirellula sediminis]MCC9608610.1 VWA domain-containing protein [Blastopirellula sediminis]MCC9628613.1 VWA domain-containing protein [Blastopirellula sediminis]